MPGPLKLTTAAYPAMALVMASSLLCSSRTRTEDGIVVDRVFPLLRLHHATGAGTFFPGSFAFNFFLPSFAIMAVFNLAFPHRFGPLLKSRVNLFYYIFALIVAILEIGADTLLPLIALPGRFGLGIAASLVHLGFFIALALAAVVTRGADRDW